MSRVGKIYSSADKEHRLQWSPSALLNLLTYVQVNPNGLPYLHATVDPTIHSKCLPAVLRPHISLHVCDILCKTTPFGGLLKPPTKSFQASDLTTAFLTPSTGRRILSQLVWEFHFHGCTHQGLSLHMPPCWVGLPISKAPKPRVNGLLKKNLSIVTFFELCVVRYACQYILCSREDNSVKVMLDNGVGIYYINCQGGARS